MSTSARAARLIVLACFVASTTAVAQRARPRFGVGLGLTAPTGDFHADSFGDGFSLGWQGLVYVDLKSPGSSLAFRGEVSYGENGANDQLKADIAAGVGQSIGFKQKMSSATANVVFHAKPARSGGPYALGGIGIYRPALSASAGGVSADSTTSKFGWTVGGGVNHTARKATTLLELRYCSVAEAFGFKSTFFALRAGLTF